MPATHASPSAWVVVDLQRAFERCETQALAVKIRDAISSGPGPVYALVQVNPPDGPLQRMRNWTGATGAGDAALIDPLLELNPKVFTKTGYGAVTPLPVEELRSFEVVYLAGADTDACVLATALSLFDAGVPVVVRPDLCWSSGGSRLHDAAIEILRRQLGTDRVPRQPRPLPDGVVTLQ